METAGGRGRHRRHRLWTGRELRRPLAPAGLALVQVRRVQQPGLRERPPDQLKGDGEPVVREPAGDRDGGQAEIADGPGEPGEEVHGPRGAFGKPELALWLLVFLLSF